MLGYNSTSVRAALPRHAQQAVSTCASRPRDHRHSCNTHISLPELFAELLLKQQGYIWVAILQTGWIDKWNLKANLLPILSDFCGGLCVWTLVNRDWFLKVQTQDFSCCVMQLPSISGALHCNTCPWSLHMSWTKNYFWGWYLWNNTGVPLSNANCIFKYALSILRGGLKKQKTLCSGKKS